MSAARFGYTVLVALVMPFAALYLLWRSLRQPAYRARWGERFGWAHYPQPLRPARGGAPPTHLPQLVQ